MPEVEAATYRIPPFDLTKVWPHKDCPLIEVGLMELNANPKNYFNEVEQAAFSPVNIVHGTGCWPDKLLQARLVSYPDAHRYRLGVNFETLPVNRPLCPVHTYNRDGSMRADENGGDAPNYEYQRDRNVACSDWSTVPEGGNVKGGIQPNSFAGPAQDTRYRELPTKYPAT